jgi:hypothetical protein
MIKTSIHSIEFANPGKQQKLSEFLTEYAEAKKFFMTLLWNTRIEWMPGKVMDITHNRFDVPNFLSTKEYHYKRLSAKAIKLVVSEVLSAIKAVTAKRRKQLYMVSKLMSDGQDTRALQRKIDSNPLSMPEVTDSFARFDSNCVSFIPCSTKFTGFLKLEGLGKAFGIIYVPVNYSSHTEKLKKKGYIQKTTWQISRSKVCSTWELIPTKSTGTKILGADQGLTTCLTLSDGQVTQKNKHGYDLKSIIDVLSRKRKGSKAFKRAQEHRTNYINWSINQLDLTDVKEVRLEKLFQMRSGTNSSRKLGHWTYTAINSQIINRCSEQGVLVREQSAVYRSQRCSSCGWTQKINRKGKEFKCQSCSHCIDADLNGALNHELDLDPIPANFTQLKLNKSGFFWLETGLFDLTGQVLTVPVVSSNSIEI